MPTEFHRRRRAGGLGSMAAARADPESRLWQREDEIGGVRWRV